jgi:hypothetical protein
MKKVMSLMLGLALTLSAVSVTFAQDTPKKNGKKKGGSKGKKKGQQKKGGGNGSL